MAMKDVLRGSSKEEIITKLKGLDSKELEEVFIDAFYAKNVRKMELCFEHTAISDNEDFFIQYCMKELNKYRDIIEIFEKFTNIQ